MRRRVCYPPGERRATGFLPAAQLPAGWLDAAEAILHRPVEFVVFQGYRDGTAVCASHVDDYDQVILSLGVTRTMEICGGSRRVRHGEFTHVAAGVSHAIPAEPDEQGERISLVFRSTKGHT